MAAEQPAGLRWQGNDPYVVVGTNATGETDVIQRATGYTPSPLSNSSLLQGGSDIANDVFPGTNFVRLWRSFTPILSPTVTFFAEWSIIPSLESAPYNLSDTFSFDLRNQADSQSLLTLQFTPGINLLPNSYTLQTLAAGSPVSTLIDLGYQSLFQVQVDMTGSSYDLSLAQINASNRSVIAQYDLVLGGVLSSGLGAADFGTVSIDWNLTSGDPAEPGSNYIIVNETSVVPEPGTFSLLAVSAVVVLALAYRRRRARC